MNAPVKVSAELQQNRQSGRRMDKKRYGWLLSPGLPVIGMGVLAGYHFGPTMSKKVFALGGPLLLHVIIPGIDAKVPSCADAASLPAL